MPKYKEQASVSGLGAEGKNFWVIDLTNIVFVGWMFCLLVKHAVERDDEYNVKDQYAFTLAHFAPVFIELGGGKLSHSVENLTQKKS